MKRRYYCEHCGATIVASDAPGHWYIGRKAVMSEHYTHEPPWCVCWTTPKTRVLCVPQALELLDRSQVVGVQSAGLIAVRRV